MSQDVIENTRLYVERELSGEASGHDYWHVYRVWKNAVAIGREEGADLHIVQLAALLHDIADYKLNGGDHDIGPQKARAWLESQHVDTDSIEHIIEIMRGLDFKGANTTTAMRTLEGRVVYDADKLDAIGAIGIARAFAYGGTKGRVLHDPNAPPLLHASFEEYKNAKGTTINHFYEKLLLLHDRMLTDAGKRMAKERHAYMDGFVSKFLSEWEGKA